jgi:ankyrin repeat protein
MNDVQKTDVKSKWTPQTLVGAALILVVLSTLVVLATRGCLQTRLGNLTQQAFAAAKMNDNPSLAALLRAKPVLARTREDDGSTLLHHLRGNNFDDVEEIVSLLVKGGADVNSQDRTGRAPLHIASMEGRLYATRVLLTHQATVDITDAEINTPLHLVAVESPTNFKDIVDLLLRNGANIEAKNKAGATPLHRAAFYGNTSLAEFLLDKGASINVTESSGWTPLHHAVVSGHSDLVKLFLARGADINAKGILGATPLHEAVIRNQKAIVVQLLANNPSVDAQAQNGATPLHLAAVNNFAEIISLLLAKGAGVNSRNGSGETPLHLAAAKGHKEAAQILVDGGADTDSKDNSGKTPLQIASERHQSAIVELLEKSPTEKIRKP